MSPHYKTSGGRELEPMGSAGPGAGPGYLSRVSDWLQGELGDGAGPNSGALVEERLKILVANLATPMFAGIVATLLGAPAISIMALLMMALGLVAARLNPQAKARQVVQCRHFVWGMLAGATFFRLMVSWSTTTSPFGLPSLMGSHTSQLVVMMGTEIMPALLYTTLVMIPLFYLRSVIEEYRAARTHRDTHRDIALAGRYRRARRY